MQMDICSHIGLSVNDVNSLHGFCVDTLESTYGVLGDFSIDELEYGVTKFLNIQDDREEASGFISPHDKCLFQTGDICEVGDQSRAPEKLFSKSVTLSCSSSKNLSSAALNVAIKEYSEDISNQVLTHDDADGESVNPDCSDSSSLPSSLKPISAMKGSREKRGLTPPQKLIVKWAPDVYDPVPTSLSHLATNKPRKHNKKKSKNKQKNGSKSSRGSKSKDKKQVRKRDLCVKVREHTEEVMFFPEIQPSAMDFHVGSPDLFCGSSCCFVNGYCSSLHLSSVAEAT